MQLLPIGKSIGRWLNLPIVFPFVVVVAVFVYLIERYKAVLKATVVLEYLKVLALPGSIAIALIVLVVVLVKYGSTISAVAQLLRTRAANQRHADGTLVLSISARRFLLIGDLYTKLRDQYCISDEDYNNWVTFAQHFKPAYSEAVETWKLAEYSSDKAINALYEGLTTLTAPLSTFEAAAFARLQPK